MVVRKAKQARASGLPCGTLFRGCFILTAPSATRRALQEKNGCLSDRVVLGDSASPDRILIGSSGALVFGDRYLLTNVYFAAPFGAETVQQPE